VLVENLFLSFSVFILMKNISLALGGGGTKGFAHIGVIRQLEKEGYSIKAVAGTSAGSIVGSLYATGFTTYEIEKFSTTLKFSDIFNRSQDDAPSLMGLGGLHHKLEEKLGNSTFSETKIPFAATAVDTHSASEIIINKGTLTTAIRASTAIPGIFPAEILGDMNLVDGGVMDPVPVAVARWLCPDCPVVAVSLLPEMENWPEIARLTVPSYVPIPHFLIEQFNQLRYGKAAQVFLDSMEIMTNMVADLKLRLDKPDVILRPAVDHYTMFDKVDINELIHLGEKAVIASRTDLEHMNSASKRVYRWLKVNKLPGRLLEE
jgi:NTE family protein